MVESFSEILWTSCGNALKDKVDDNRREGSVRGYFKNSGLDIESSTSTTEFDIMHQIRVLNIRRTKIFISIIAREIFRLSLYIL